MVSDLHGIVQILLVSVMLNVLLSCVTNQGACCALKLQVKSLLCGASSFCKGKLKRFVTCKVLFGAFWKILQDIFVSLFS